MFDYPVAKVISDFPNLRLIELDSNGDNVDDSEWQIAHSLEFRSKKIHLNSSFNKDFSAEKIENELLISIEMEPKNFDWMVPSHIPVGFFGSEEEISSATVLIHSRSLSKGFLEHSEVFGFEDDGLTFNIHLDEKKINSLQDSILHSSFSHIYFKVGLDGIYADGIEVKTKLKILSREDEIIDSEANDLPRLTKIQYFDIRVVNQVESNEDDE